MKILYHNPKLTGQNIKFDISSPNNYVRREGGVGYQHSLLMLNFIRIAILILRRSRVDLHVGLSRHNNTKLKSAQHNNRHALLQSLSKSLWNYMSTCRVGVYMRIWPIIKIMIAKRFSLSTIRVATCYFSIRGCSPII